jgi:membrane protease YdiL (CAAX protease family)
MEPHASDPATTRGWLRDGPPFALVTWFVAFVGMLCAAGAAAAVFAVLAAVRGERDQQRLAEAAQTPAALWCTLPASQLATVVVVLVACRIRGVRVRERLGLFATRLRTSDCALLLVATVVPFALGVLAAAGVARITGETDANPLTRMWSEGSRAASVAWVFCIALVPGVVEECFFRGFLQRTLLREWRPARTIAVTSVLFGLAHITPPAVVFASILGAWLGVVAWRTGSVALTIAMHALLNGTWTAVQMIAARGSVSETAWYVASGVAIALGLAACVPALRVLRRCEPASATPWPSRGLLGRALGATAVVACVLYAVIPAGAVATPRRTPTPAELRERAAISVACPLDGEVEFALADGAPVRIALPPDAHRLGDAIIALDDARGLVWLAYDGEVSGKGNNVVPRRGIIEQLSGDDPARLRIRFDDAVARPLRAWAALLREQQRIDAALAQAAAEDGWSTRGRLSPQASPGR